MSFDHAHAGEDRWRSNFCSAKFRPLNGVIFIKAQVNDFHPGSKDEQKSIPGWLKALF